jgi:Na+/melibiose symporter-like transporter
VLLGLFAAWERRTEVPMIDLGLLRNPRFSAASGAIALMFFAMFGVLFVMTQYLQSVLGHDALGAGLRTIPLAAGLVVAAPLSAKLGPKVGTKALVTAGLLLVAAALVWLSGAQVDSGFGLIAGSLALMGFGTGLAMAPATDAIMASVPADHASIGSAVNDTNRLVGGALGVAVLGSLLSGAYRGDMESATAGLPAAGADAASGTIGGAAEVAGQLGGPAGAAVQEAAATAFVGAMHTTLLVAAGVAALAALLAVWRLPSRDAQVAAAEPEADRRAAAEPVPA